MSVEFVVDDLLKGFKRFDEIDFKGRTYNQSDFKNFEKILLRVRARRNLFGVEDVLRYEGNSIIKLLELVTSHQFIVDNIDMYYASDLYREIRAGNVVFICESFVNRSDCTSVVISTNQGAYLINGYEACLLDGYELLLMKHFVVTKVLYKNPKYSMEDYEKIFEKVPCIVKQASSIINSSSR